MTLSNIFLISFVFPDQSNPIRYTIHSGDPEGYFTLDSTTGVIRTAATLDHEVTGVLLLSVQASSGSPPLYSYAQVKVTIEDRNDNAPEFESTTIRLSVPESAALGLPLYTVVARDKDSGDNGKIRYHLASGNFGDSRLFAVDQTSGHLSLSKHLDYETSQRHTIVVSATDQGDPPMSSNLTVLLEVQDVNDNPPVFERSEYFVSVSEALPAKSQVRTTCTPLYVLVEGQCSLVCWSTLRLMTHSTLKSELNSPLGSNSFQLDRKILIKIIS